MHISRARLFQCAALLLLACHGLAAQHSGHHLRRWEAAAPQKHQYTGQQHDPETGLLHFQARMYNPVIARFLGVDPLAASFPTLSPYHYCYANPLNYIDPLGLAGESWIKDANGNITWDPRFHSKDEFDKNRDKFNIPKTSEYVAESFVKDGFYYTASGFKVLDINFNKLNYKYNYQYPNKYDNGSGGINYVQEAAFLVPGIYGARQSATALQNGQYGQAIGWYAYGVADVFLFGYLTKEAFAARTGIAMLENTAAKGGTTVLGHYPEYVKLAESIGARRFQIPTSVWNKMSAAEQWAANTKFLDRMILRGDNIRLATPLNQVKPGSFFQKELN